MTKIEVSKDWCINMSKMEDGQEIGAGSPDHPLRITGLEALLCDAQSEAERLRLALQRIWETTTDDRARKVAADALAMSV